jgi:hypothetical protein
MARAALFVIVSSRQPSWKKPIPMAASRKPITTVAESAGGRWQQDNQRMSGFSVNCRHASQKDWQDHGTGEVKEGNRSEHIDDELNKRCFGKGCDARLNGLRFIGNRRVNVGRNKLGCQVALHIYMLIEV